MSQHSFGKRLSLLLSKYEQLILLPNETVCTVNELVMKEMSY
jgi:hypothetical protein